MDRKFFVTVIAPDRPALVRLRRYDLDLFHQTAQATSTRAVALRATRDRSGARTYEETAKVNETREFVIDGLLLWRYPTGALRLEIGGEAVPILGVRMRVGSLLASGISLAVGAALLLFFRATTLGRAARSVIQDELGARLVGISPAAVRTFIFALSGALAGLVAVTRSMTSPVSVTAGFDFTILALIVAVVGGLGSVAGAFLAGVLLGIVSTVSAFYIGQYITTIVLLAAAALTIVMRPRGLLGR